MLKRMFKFSYRMRDLRDELNVDGPIPEEFFAVSRWQREVPDQLQGRESLTALDLERFRQHLQVESNVLDDCTDRRTVAFGVWGRDELIDWRSSRLSEELRNKFKGDR